MPQAPNRYKPRRDREALVEYRRGCQEHPGYFGKGKPPDIMCDRCRWLIAKKRQMSANMGIGCSKHKAYHGERPPAHKKCDRCLWMRQIFLTVNG